MDLGRLLNFLLDIQKIIARNAPGTIRCTPPLFYALQEVCKLTQTPAEGRQRIAEREDELEQLLDAVDRQLSDPNSELRLEKGRLVLTPLKAEKRPASADLLSDIIAERLPRIDITDLLIEVDTWVHFSDHFKHTTGNEPRGPQFLLHLYACLLAQAGNFGLSQMAQNSGLAHHQLLVTARQQEWLCSQTAHLSCSH